MAFLSSAQYCVLASYHHLHLILKLSLFQKEEWVVWVAFLEVVVLVLYLLAAAVHLVVFLLLVVILVPPRLQVMSLHLAPLSLQVSCHLVWLLLAPFPHVSLYQVPFRLVQLV